MPWQRSQPPCHGHRPASPSCRRALPACAASSLGAELAIVRWALSGSRVSVLHDLRVRSRADDRGDWADRVKAHKRRLPGHAVVHALAPVLLLLLLELDREFVPSEGHHRARKGLRCRSQRKPGCPVSGKFRAEGAFYATPVDVSPPRRHPVRPARGARAAPRPARASAY